MPLRAHTLHLGPLDNNTYVLTCEATRESALVDIGFEPEVVLRHVAEQGLVVRWLLATHAHWDHVAGMREAQEALGVPCLLHPEDRLLMDHLQEQGDAFGLPRATPPRDIQPLAEGVPVTFGEVSLEVIHTPGHSPGHVTFRFGDDLWVGDVLFAGSIGRTDLPGGSFEALEHSIRAKLFPLGDHLRAHPGHGPSTTLGRERATNPFVGDGARFA